VTVDSNIDPKDAPDASDVVVGPVGSASLKDPSTSGPIGADLAALEPIDVPSDDPAGQPAD
jgi:hypothetical protein